MLTFLRLSGIIPLLLLCLVLSSCDKEDSNPLTFSNKDLVGRWKITSTTYTQYKRNGSEYSWTVNAENGTCYYLFRSDNTYETRQNEGQFTPLSGPYSVRKSDGKILLKTNNTNLLEESKIEVVSSGLFIDNYIEATIDPLTKGIRYKETLIKVSE